MNIKQLELKRWRELLSAARKGRMLTQQKRNHLARYLRLDKAAIDAWNAAARKLAFIVNGDSSFQVDDFETIDSDAREHIAHLEESAEWWDERVKMLEREVARVSKSKKLTAPSLPIEERIAKRRRSANKNAKLAKAKAAELDEIRRHIAIDIKDAVKAAGNVDGEVALALSHLSEDPCHEGPMWRSVLRARGRDDLFLKFTEIEETLGRAGLRGERFKRLTPESSGFSGSSIGKRS